MKLIEKISIILIYVLAMVLFQTSLLFISIWLIFVGVSFWLTLPMLASASLVVIIMIVERAMKDLEKTQK